MKFRCERDTLADAVSTAQRAVASRTGALPVLSGLRLTVSRDGVEVVGSDLELTIRVRATAQVDTDGVAVLPARLFADRVFTLLLSSQIVLLAVAFVFTPGVIGLPRDKHSFAMRRDPSSITESPCCETGSG